MANSRIAVAIGAGAVALIATGVAVATGIGVAASVDGETVEMTLRFGEGYSRSSGPNPDGVSVQSLSTHALVSVPGLPPLAIGLHLAAGVLAAVAPLSIAVFALIIGIGLWRGRPFARRITRGLVLASGSLLALTVASQLLAWASRVVAIGAFTSEHSPSFSLAPEFEPLFTTTAVGLFIVAIAFRLGSRSDRITEGLV